MPVLGGLPKDMRDMSNKITSLRRKAQRARERESLKAFSHLFPACRRVVYERQQGIDAVLCLDCGNCLFMDLKEGIVSTGCMYEEIDESA